MFAFLTLIYLLLSGLMSSLRVLIHRKRAPTIDRFKSASPRRFASIKELDAGSFALLLRGSVEAQCRRWISLFVPLRTLY